jgi:hypothetical protein
MSLGFLLYSSVSLPFQAFLSEENGKVCLEEEMSFKQD